MNSEGEEQIWEEWRPEGGRDERERWGAKGKIHRQLGEYLYFRKFS